ncbi:MAG: hypothetical protein HC898_07795 [Phycisphaerales bacterium]|nr:hypothetical protein [Phycisphaerales bacterium]
MRACRAGWWFVMLMTTWVLFLPASLTLAQAVSELPASPATVIVESTPWSKSMSLQPMTLVPPHGCSLPPLWCC